MDTAMTAQLKTLQKVARMKAQVHLKPGVGWRGGSILKGINGIVLFIVINFLKM